MIKKNTIAIFIEGNKKRTEELIGGIPLSVGEIMIMKDKGKNIAWKVTDKKVIYADDKGNQEVTITYVFEKN